MPRIGKKTARISQHAHEAPQEAIIGKGIELPLHRFLLIEKPPAATKLQLTRNGAVLEITGHRRENIIIRRVKIIEHGPRKLIGRIKGVEIPTQPTRLPKVTDGIEARIRSELLQLSRIISPQRPEVQLLRPAAGRIPPP